MATEDNQIKNNVIIINSVTGKEISTKLRYFITFLEFKEFICQQWFIPIDQLFILLPHGMKLKKTHFIDLVSKSHEEKIEMYVFDRRLFGEIRSQEALLSQLTRHYSVTLVKPLASPLVHENYMGNTLSFKKILSLLTTNLGWLSALETDVLYFHQFISDSIKELKHIFQCLDVVSQYLELYCYDVENIYNSNVEFVSHLQENTMIKNWKSTYYTILNSIDAVTTQGKLNQFLNYNDLIIFDKRLKELDKSLNLRLKKLKRKIEENFESRNKISLHINDLKHIYKDDLSNYDMEEQMMAKFKEMINDIKTKTQVVMNGKEDKFTSEDLSELTLLVKDMRNTSVSQLYTIAQSLFTQATKSFESKKSLQLEIISCMGEISQIQVQILGIKDVLSSNVRNDVEQLHMLELSILKTNDLPLIYGFYLIELYRRQYWLEHVNQYHANFYKEFRMIAMKEKEFRRTWVEGIDSIITSFQWDSDEIKSDMISFPIVEKTKRNKITLEQIDQYITQASESNVDYNIIHILKKNLEEIKYYRVKLYNYCDDHNTITIDHSDKKIIESYKLRIKKLESLLHNAHFSSYDAWPSGILNNKSQKTLRNNVINVQEKIHMYCAEIGKYNMTSGDLEIRNKLTDIKLLLGNVTEEKNTMEEQLKVTKSKLSDMEDERNAYQETLSTLNKELSKMITNQELIKIEKSKIENESKFHIDSIIKQNTDLLNELDTWKAKCGTLDEMNNGLLSTIEDLKSSFEKERDKLTAEVDQLREEIDSLKSERNNSKIKLNNTLISDQSPNIPIDDIVALKKWNKRLECDLYDVFASSAFILENIGLLLSRDSNNCLQIIRVKGLRKDLEHSILDNSNIPSHLLKSSVFQEMKTLYESIRNGQDDVSHGRVISYLEDLYSNKLYESTVIKRFKDIESLAKKLRKENKIQKTKLEKCCKEKVTINNFQIGDLALFLPTRDDIGSLTSSISSLSSVFSSVDLSTPSPLDTPSIVPKNCPNNLKLRPWAAFTPFNDNFRYFLADGEKIAKNRDWFIGKITHLQKHTINNDSINPYKLPVGTVWFQVTASFLEKK